MTTTLVTKFDKDLPETIALWKAAVDKYNAVSIHDLKSAHSASEITVQQVLSLKVIWPKLRTSTDLTERGSLFGSSKTEINKARDLNGDKDKAWGVYLEHLASTTKKRPSSVFSQKLGAYSLVLQAQVEVSKITQSSIESSKLLVTPMKLRDRPERNPKGKERECSNSSQPSVESKGSSAPEQISPMRRGAGADLEIGDEQIVNGAAINFLNALFIHEERQADWTMERKQFKFVAKNSIKFEARTDGHLKLHGEARSAAILEVKSRTRFWEEGSRIEMQESAQMALWIYREPNSHWVSPSPDDKNFYRVLLSQDHKEIYVTIAEYTEEYVLYLQDAVKFDFYDNKTFLKMRCYGPFHTDSDNNMAWLAGILRELLPYAAICKVPRQLSPSENPAVEERTGRSPARHTEAEQRRRPNFGDSEGSADSVSSRERPLRQPKFSKPQSQGTSPQRGSTPPVRESSRPRRTESPLKFQDLDQSSVDEQTSGHRGRKSDKSGDKKLQEKGKQTQLPHR